MTTPQALVAAYFLSFEGSVSDVAKTTGLFVETTATIMRRFFERDFLSREETEKRTYIYYAEERHDQHLLDFVSRFNINKRTDPWTIIRVMR